MSAPPFSLWPFFIAALALMLMFGVVTELMLAAMGLRHTATAAQAGGAR
jgi:hypothetical protein